MKITLTERFQRECEDLKETQKSQVFSTLLKLPGAVRESQRHSGLGLRKIHTSGIFEARVGLGLRIVFGFERETLTLHRVGTHDEIQKYLRNL